MQPLPIDPLLPALVESLRLHPTLVLEAPPGAGKTTRVPRALLDGGFAAEGAIVVLEPRRLAARLAARRVAEELSETVGGTAGYQVRFEDVSSPRTRIRFVTEGILGRRLLSSPRLEGVAVVVLDEFHERHLPGDVALALVERVRRSTRPDLRVIAMSATLATPALAAYLGAPILRSEGRLFEVRVEHLRAADDRPLALQVASAVRRLVAEGLAGDVLVFLPGAAEIRRALDACAKVAAEADLALVPLHGDLSPAEQDRAIRRLDRRKVILSTNVAESSVTIDGVVAVVDSGLARVASQAPWSGLMRLRVEKISRASAKQRAGRAGRTAPGRCLRLYTEADHDVRPEHDIPEIRRLDFAPTRLDLAAMDAEDVPWLEPPPEPSVRAADELLTRLGALDASGRLTATGREMVRFAVHPRIARVLVEGRRRGIAHDASVAAAILAEGDLRAATRHLGPGTPADTPTERSDLTALVDAFHEVEASAFSAGATRAAGLDPGAVRAVARAATQLERAGRVGSETVSPCDSARAPYPRETRAAVSPEQALCIALLAGYPDRVARRVRPGGRAIAMGGGQTAELSQASVVRDAPWLVALDAEERPDTAGRARAATTIRLASAIEPEWLIDLFPDQVAERREVIFDPPSERIQAREMLVWDGLVLHETETEATPEEASRALAEAAVAAGPRAFAPEGAYDRWLARARFAASAVGGGEGPSDQAVSEVLVDLCQGRRSFAELRSAGLMARLQALGPRLDLDRLAPERVTLPSGRSTPVRYEAGKPPTIASRLQDFFGMTQGPRLGGRVPVLLELLAPNGRAVQVTTDLSGFWEKHYPGIRKTLMRRYPRHAWPEDPTKRGPA